MIISYSQSSSDPSRVECIRQAYPRSLTKYHAVTHLVEESAIIFSRSMNPRRPIIPLNPIRSIRVVQRTPIRRAARRRVDNDASPFRRARFTLNDLVIRRKGVPVRRGRPAWRRVRSRMVRAVVADHRLLEVSVFPTKTETILERDQQSPRGCVTARNFHQRSLV